MERTIQIADGIYWVGSNDDQGGLNCNPYLIIDGDDVILVDPGSVLDFEYVYENVTSLVRLEDINYVILHHQDPDFCSSVPLFEKKGAKFQIVTHWRTATLVKFYGIQSPYYIVNENEFKLVLQSGRTLGFVLTPYLHFPGAIVTYDYQTQILFSSDLFGAITHDWSLFADDNYIEKMKTFHEHYMPSNEILRPVMELLLTMDISIIAPQHGSIINDRIKDHIEALRDLECGTFLHPIKKEVAKSGGYRAVCSKVIKRYASIFKKEEVLEALNGLDITMDEEQLEITDYNYRGIELWNLMFDHLLTKKDISWLVIIEPMVQGLSNEFDIPMPQVFQNTLIKAQQEASSLSKENAELKEMNAKLNTTIKETQEQLIKCPITGLYNYTFFKTYLVKSIKGLLADGIRSNAVLIVIQVDNMTKIKFSYGDDEADLTLKNLVYTMNNVLQDNMMLFRLQGASFGCYISNIEKEQAVGFADTLRNAINSSVKFIEKITVSIGVASLDEIENQEENEQEIAGLMYDAALKRVKVAKRIGTNIVCSNTQINDSVDETGKILIVDTDEINIDVLKTILENMKYQVLTAMDGEEALRICEKEMPTLIISEIMLPKLDAFQVRKRLLSQSMTKNITFLIVSHLKNEDSLQQAAALEIKHYLKKPYMLSELIGIIKNIAKGDANESFR